MRGTTGNDAATKMADRKNGEIALSCTPEELRRFYAAYVCGQGEADDARIRAALRLHREKTSPVPVPGRSARRVAISTRHPMTSVIFIRTF
jgi:hypothetical protein